jgi:hypothetical protein
MSCLFNSLSHLLGIDSSVCRDAICNYLERNLPIIDGMETKDVLAFEAPHYVERMRLPHTWGGAIEIQAACNIWKVRIVVENRRHHGSPSVIEFVALTSHDCANTLRIYWTGGHYEPMSVT